jgi:hypothetical protein
MPFTPGVSKYLLACCLFAAATFAGEVSVEEGNAAMEPRERPTVFQSDGYGYDYYGPAYYYPGYHRYYSGYWGGYGYPYGAFYPPMVGEIGKSNIWMAAGSHGYLGGGFSTRQPIEDTPYVYGVAISREKGRAYYSGLNYDQTVISPWLEWHGEKSMFTASFTHASTSFSGTPYHLRERPSVESSPISPASRRHEMDGRYEYNEIRAGVTRRLFDNIDASFHISNGRWSR